MKRFFYLLAICSVAFSSCSKQAKLSDENASKETKALFKNLQEIQEKGFLFGHQDALAYGVNWKYEEGRSDVKDVTGDYPAVYGWELGHLEIGHEMNLDSVPFDKMNQFIKDAYQRGGIITISWHGRNPMTDSSAWDPAPGTVNSVLPGGPFHDKFKEQLNKVADFLLNLKGNNGELIPVLFRPFHELTGGWFWWGIKSSSVEEYKELFRFSVHYLRDTQKLNNLIIVYNTGSEFDSVDEFLARYPGDDVVDILSFDTYQGGDAEKNDTYMKDLDRRLTILEEAGQQQNKPVTIGETGYNQIPYSKWWTQRLLKGIENHKFLYVLMWRNVGLKYKENQVEYFVPFKGHISEPDFVEFYNHPRTLFQSDISYSQMYE